MAWVPLQIDSTLALVVVLVAALGATAVGLAAIYFEHRQQAMLIETGEYDPSAEARETRSLVLAVGLLLTAYGLGSFVQGLSSNAAGFRGVVPGMLGLALVVFYVVRRKEG